MIRQVGDKKTRGRFLKQCAGKEYFGCVLPLHLELFGRSQPGRFFAGPTLALEVGGRTAALAGHCDPEELASFLRLCGSPPVMTEEQVPAGWQVEREHHIFVLEPGRMLPIPAVEETLWQSFDFQAEPKPGRVADFLFSARGDRARRDDFYSELCVKRNHGKALVWAVEQDGEIVCTVGAYALHGGSAYLACGQTREELRGQGIGGRLIVLAANTLAAHGYRVTFLCADERVHFYTRLGFTQTGRLLRCVEENA